METWALRDDLETPLLEDPNEAEDEDEVGVGVGVGVAVCPPDEFVVPLAVVPLAVVSLVVVPLAVVSLVVDGVWVVESDVMVVEPTPFAALTVLPL